MVVNTQQAKKLMAGAVILSLALSGGLLAGTERAGAAGSSGLSRQGLSASQVAQLQDMKTRWRKQTDGSRHAGTAILEESAGIIGIGVEELKKQLQAGKSLAEIAEAKGIKKDALAEKLVANRAAKLDEAVKTGKITQERADTIKSKLSGHINKMVDRKGWSEDGGFHGKGGRMAGLLSQLGPEKLASIVGVSSEELIRELKGGKSLADIAKSKGIGKEELINRIQKALEPKLEEAVESKRPAKSTSQETQE